MRESRCYSPFQSGGRVRLAASLSEEERAHVQHTFHQRGPREERNRQASRESALADMDIADIRNHD